MSGLEKHTGTEEVGGAEGGAGCRLGQSSFLSEPESSRSQLHEQKLGDSDNRPQQQQLESSRLHGLCKQARGLPLWPGGGREGGLKRVAAKKGGRAGEKDGDVTPSRSQ